MPKIKKSLPDNGRLGNFVLPDKEAINSNLKQFQAGVKKKEDVEATVDVFFEQMRRLNLGRR